VRHLTQHQLSAAIDGALVGVSLQLVERHLEACEPCRLRSVRLHRTHEALMVLFRFEGGPALVESHGEESAPAAIPAVAIPPAAIIASEPIAAEPPRLAIVSAAMPSAPDEDDALDDLDDLDSETGEDAFAPIELASGTTIPTLEIAAVPAAPRMLRTVVVKPVESRPVAAEPPEPRPVVLKVETGSGRPARRSRKRRSSARSEEVPSVPAQEPVLAPPLAATSPPDPPARDGTRAARPPRDMAPQLVSAALGVLLVATVAGIIVLLGRPQRTGEAPPFEVRHAGGPSQTDRRSTRAAESRSAPAASDAPSSPSASSAPAVVESPARSPAGPAAAAPADTAPPAAAVRKPPGRAAVAPPRPAMGLLCGEVTDEDGVPVAGARILLADMEVGVVTDRRGRFCVSAPRGDRTVSVVALGFATYRLLLTMDGQTASLSIRLRSGAIPTGPGPP
jgi:carboxypeptidase family protein/putative zinc finger protein